MAFQKAYFVEDKKKLAVECEILLIPEWSAFGAMNMGFDSESDGIVRIKN